MKSDRICCKSLKIVHKICSRDTEEALVLYGDRPMEYGNWKGGKLDNTFTACRIPTQISTRMSIVI